MATPTDRLQSLLASRQGRRPAAQLAASVAGAAILLRAGMSSDGPLAFAQDDDDDGSGRGRGRGRGGDEDNSGPGNAEDRGEDQDEELEQIPEIPAGSLEVRIVGDDAGDFVPGELTLDVGQSVTFVNVHSDEHTATGSGFDTGIIPDEGGTATVVLDTPGVFPYACQIHPEMTGVIRVRDENGAVPGTRTATQEIPADAKTVVIANLAFNPAVLTVPTGTRVSWTNDDSVPHTVTSADGVFDSGIFDPGGSFAFTFNEPGSFPYFCQLHPQMHGTVTAEGESVPGGATDAQTAQVEAEATPAAAARPAPDASSGTAVSIVDFAFEPATFEIAVGGTVVWTNEGLAPHTVTGDFADSGVLDPGQTFSHTFESEETFDYFCAIHPDMVGSVKVGAAQAAPSTPIAASGPETTAPDGVWLLQLIPDNDVILGAQQALLAFHTDGMLEADFAAGPGNGIPANLITSGRGEWIVRDGLWAFALAALMNDADKRFAATVMFDGEGQLTANGASLEGTFDFELIAADGQVIEQGTGTFSGRPLPLDP